MSEKKQFPMGEFLIELLVNPDTNDPPRDNINAYDNNGTLLWNISELLKQYAKISGSKYEEEIYFDIRLLENGNILHWFFQSL